MSRAFARSLLISASMVAIYAAVPVPGAAAAPVLAWVFFAIGLVALAVVVVHLVRRQLQSPDDAGVRIETLVALLYAVVVFFSLVYLSLASRDGELEGIHNRVDALYFTMATLATVGYGDVHAVGRAARIVVTLQMFFDLSFLAVAARRLGPVLLHRSPATGEAPAPATPEIAQDRSHP